MTRQQLFKLLLHRDLVLPFISIIFFVAAFVSINDLGLKLSDLYKYKGVFAHCDSTIIKIKDKPLFKQVTKRLNVKLEGIPYNFIVKTTENFGYITSQITRGDTIFIWTKTNKEQAYQTNMIAINHLVSKDKTIVDFYRTFAVTPKLIAFFLVPAFGFLLWYWLKIKKRLKKLNY